MKLSVIITVSVALWAAAPQQTAGPYQATGIKIGEVTDTTAIVWTRLTRLPQRVGSEAPMPTVLYRNPKTGEMSAESQDKADSTPVVQFPEGVTVETIEGAVPGTRGKVRLLYRPAASQHWLRTTWAPVDPDQDFTRQFRLKNLRPDTRYEVRVESRGQQSGPTGQALDGNFKTAPSPDRPARVVFAVTTCHEYDNRDDGDNGFKMYPAVLKFAPDFFVHTGDIIYYDRLAKTLPLARWHWARIYSLPTNLEFHRQVASYFIKDDHDTWMNDCWPGMPTQFMGEFTFEQGQAVFLEQVPMGDRTYRTFRWGRDLQIWLVEGRDFRSPNTMPDGPEKTIWGKPQKAWFKRTVEASDATFRILISPTPLVGPDRPQKNDNHANAGFAHEGKELRQFISQQKNMVVVCGDRHWQYVSVDPETGLREYSCGPASDKHAGGWSKDDVRPQHRYLNVIGGFLLVTVERHGGSPLLLFQHCDVNGNLLHEDRLEDVEAR